MYPASPRADVNVNDIPTLTRVYAGMKRPAPLESPTNRNQLLSATASTENASYSPNVLWNRRISVWKGNIVKLKVDAIINAANEGLRGGGGVCGAIFQAAGKQLLQRECDNLEPLSRNEKKWVKCPPGRARITSACKMMPEIKHIIHAVGPIGENPSILTRAYQSVLDLAHEHDLKTVAFPCISTGIYGYNIKKATPVALKAVRDWLDENPEKGEKLERIIFCIFDDVDLQVYLRYIHVYFPNAPGMENINQQADDTNDTATQSSDASVNESTECKPSTCKKVKGDDEQEPVQEEKTEEATEKVETPTESQGKDESEDGKDSKAETSPAAVVPSPSSSSSSSLSSNTKNSTLEMPTNNTAKTKDTEASTNQSEDDDDFVHI